MSRQHYVYVHRRADDGTIFYVGKGKDRRAWSSSGRNRWWRFASAKHGHTVQIVREGMSEPCALAFERITIARIGLSNLVNLVDGGGGTQGWKHSEEARRKIGAFNKGRKLTDKMREALERHRYAPRTAEHRKNMSLARAGRKFGPHSAETRAKISASHIGLRPSEESRRKMSLAKVGKRCGRDSPSYDHAMRTFRHPDHGQFVGTRAEFIAAFSLANGCVSAVIHGRQKSVKGWRLACPI